MPNIRLATPADHDAIWEIFHAVVAPGDSYAFDPEIPRDEAWVIGFTLEPSPSLQSKMAKSWALTFSGAISRASARMSRMRLSWFRQRLVDAVLGG